MIYYMKNQSNIMVIKNGLVEKSSRRKVVSPVDSSFNDKAHLPASGQVQRLVRSLFMDMDISQSEKMVPMSPQLANSTFCFRVASDGDSLVPRIEANIHLPSCNDYTLQDCHLDYNIFVSQDMLREFLGL